MNAPDSSGFRDRKTKYPALEDCLNMFCAKAWMTMVIWGVMVSKN